MAAAIIAVVAADLAEAGEAVPSNDEILSAAQAALEDIEQEEGIHPLLLDQEDFEEDVEALTPTTTLP